MFFRNALKMVDFTKKQPKIGLKRRFHLRQSVMLNDPVKVTENEPIEIRCYFVRERNALVVRGDFGDLYRDYYLHLMQHGLRQKPEWDRLLKEALAALALHLASRPRTESTAWTVNLADPTLNIFVTGGNRGQNVTGRVFSENVRQMERNLFFSQTTTDGQSAAGTRQSTVEFEGMDLFCAVETYYRQSEQRPARYFHLGGDDFVMISAQPDCDMPWFLTLDDDAVRDLDQHETLSLLERRFFRFDCGCHLGRIYPIIASLSPMTREEVFAGGSSADAACPRCGAHYEITREGLAAFLEAADAC